MFSSSTTQRSYYKSIMNYGYSLPVLFSFLFILKFTVIKQRKKHNSIENMIYSFSLNQAKTEPYPGTTSATQIPDPVPRRKALYTYILLAENSQFKYWHCHLGTCQGTTDTTLSLARLHFLHQQNGNHDNIYYTAFFQRPPALFIYIH